VAIISWLVLQLIGQKTAIVQNFLQKCGLITASSSILPNTMITIEQEIAKLSSIPKDNHEVTSFWQGERPRNA
jgi:hypothetical protein